MAPAARCLTVLLTLAVLLGHSGQALGLQGAGVAAVNPPSYEELTTSLVVNQLALLQLMQDASNAASCMTAVAESCTERKARREEEAAARDASHEEMLKLLLSLQAGQQRCSQETLEFITEAVNNATQETLTGLAALRQELESEVASLREEIQQQQNRPVEETTSHASVEGDALSACPDGWLRHESSCYLVDDTGRTWEDSLAYCRSLGGDLAKITSADEQVFIKGKLQGDTWIGLNDRATENHWVWTDGSAATYTAWSHNEPNNYEGSDEDCVHMRGGGFNYQWNDYPCNNQGRVVCERAVGA